MATVLEQHRTQTCLDPASSHSTTPFNRPQPRSRDPAQFPAGLPIFTQTLCLQPPASTFADTHLHQIPHQPDQHIPPGQAPSTANPIMPGTEGGEETKALSTSSLLPPQKAPRTGGHACFTRQGTPRRRARHTRSRLRRISERPHQPTPSINRTMTDSPGIMFPCFLHHHQAHPAQPFFYPLSRLGPASVRSEWTFMSRQVFGGKPARRSRRRGAPSNALILFIMPVLPTPPPRSCKVPIPATHTHTRTQTTPPF